MHLLPAICTRAAVLLLSLLCVPYHTVRLHQFAEALQRSCGGTLQHSCRGQTSFSPPLEMRSSIPICLGVMGAAGSPPISSSLSPESSGIRPRKMGAREEE